MTDKVLLFRNVRTGNWQYNRGEPMKINPKSHIGYRYYRSFNSIVEAQVYARDVEKGEDVFRAKQEFGHSERNDNLNKLAFD